MFNFKFTQFNLHDWKGIVALDTLWFQLRYHYLTCTTLTRFFLYCWIRRTLKSSISEWKKNRLKGHHKKILRNVWTIGSPTHAWRNIQ
jgi:hypothetical protein